MNQDLLQRYIEGTATESERMEVAEWVRADEEHLREYQALRKLHSIVLWNPQAESSITTKRLWSRVRTLLRYAAMIVFVTAAFALWKAYRQRPVAPVLTDEMAAVISQAEQNGKSKAVCTIDGTPSVVANNAALANAHAVHQSRSAAAVHEATLTTYHDSEFWLTLSDSTRVHLNYGTSLVYPTRFKGGTREVELKGEAYFYVAKDKKHPFIIHTPTGNVKVYGTEFNVNTCDEAGTTRIVLVNGSVGVTPKGGEEVMMRPNDMAVMQAGVCDVMVTQVDTYLSTAWNSGSFVFDNCPMTTLMKVLSKWYRKQVTYGSSDIQQIRFTGELDKYQPLEQTLKGISSITGLRITLKKDVIYIED